MGPQREGNGLALPRGLTFRIGGSLDLAGPFWFLVGTMTTAIRHHSHAHTHPLPGGRLEVRS